MARPTDPGTSARRLHAGLLLAAFTVVVVAVPAGGIGAGVGITNAACLGCSSIEQFRIRETDACRNAGPSSPRRGDDLAEFRLTPTE